MKKAVLPLVVVATCAVFFAVLWAAGWIKPPIQNTPETKKPQELILGKWEGINSQGLPIGMDFSDKGVVKMFTRVTVKIGDKTNDGPFTVTATYKFVDDDTLETELAFGKIQTNRSKIVLAQNDLVITPENKEPQTFKRVNKFSIELTKPAPESPKAAEAAQLNPSHELTGHSGKIASVAFSHDSRFLVSASHDNTVRIWDVATRKSIAEIKDVVRVSKNEGGEAKKTTAFVTEAIFSPDGNTLAIRGSNSTVVTWDITKKTVVITIEKSGWGMAFSPDGKYLVAGIERYNSNKFDFEQFVTVTDAHNGKELLSIPAIGRGGQLTFSPDGRHLFQGGNEITVWDTATRKPILPPGTFGNWLRDDVTVNYGTKQVATIEGNQIKLYDLDSGKEKKVISIGKRLTKVAFSPGGKRLASNVRAWGADAPYAVNLWDVASGKEVLKLNGHTAEVTCLAFSPDGKWLASGGADNTVKLWKVESSDDPPLPLPAPKPSFKGIDDKSR